MHQIRQNARPTIRERREKRAQIREREGRSRLAAPTSGAIVDRAVRSTSALVRRLRRSSIDERARRTRTARRSMSGAIVRWETSALVDRWSRRSIDDCDRAPRRSLTRCDRRTSGAIVPLSLIWALSLSLSLSLSGSELKWKWGEKFISGSKVKFVVNRKSFSGK